MSTNRSIRVRLKDNGAVFEYQVSPEVLRQMQHDFLTANPRQVSSGAYRTDQALVRGCYEVISEGEERTLFIIWDHVLYIE